MHNVPMLPVLETARLRLRPRRLSDVAANLAMDIDPAVHRYIYDQPPDPQAHRDRLEHLIASGWPPLGGVWVVEWKGRPGFVGWCGLFPLEQSGYIEIGYRFVRDSWGKGVATEAGRRVLDHGFRELRLDPIVAVTHPDNRASQSVIAKLGLRPQPDALHYKRWLKFFRLDRDAYLTVRP